MTFKWHKIGDQDECLRQVCFLGPWILEYCESHWENQGPLQEDKLIMKSRAYKWDSELKKYIPVKTGIPPSAFLVKDDEPKMVLEYWYAKNVLFEEDILGKDKE